MEDVDAGRTEEISLEELKNLTRIGSHAELIE